MAMSGISVTDDVKALYQKMKKDGNSDGSKYAFFRISDDKKNIVVDVENTSGRTEDYESDKASFESMKAELTNEPRYILYDFGFMNKESRKIHKLAFIFWSDDNGPIKQKMLYASSKDTIKKAFDGVAAEFQANDKGDLDYDAMAAHVDKK